MYNVIRRTLVASTIAAVLLFAIALSALAEPSPFVGSWRGVNDPGDMSNITINIGGPSAGGTYNVVMLDDYSSTCFRELNVHVRDWVHANGVVTGNVLDASGMLWCMTKPPQPLRTIFFDLTYDEVRDTLLLIGTFEFHRKGH
jgi:hypothetical protein